MIINSVDDGCLSNLLRSYLVGFAMVVSHSSRACSCLMDLAAGVAVPFHYFGTSLYMGRHCCFLLPKVLISGLVWENDKGT